MHHVTRIHHCTALMWLICLSHRELMGTEFRAHIQQVVPRYSCRCQVETASNIHEDVHLSESGCTGHFSDPVANVRPRCGPGIAATAQTHVPCAVVGPKRAQLWHNSIIVDFTSITSPYTTLTKRLVAGSYTFFDISSGH